MKRNSRQDSIAVKLLNESYHYHKRVVFESEHAVKKYDLDKVGVSRSIVQHMECVASDFTGKIRLIIDNEIIGDNLNTKWYLEYFSTPSYYSYKQRAYAKYLENLEK